jgi:hypothetical protein
MENSFFLCLVDIVGMNLPEVKLNGLGVPVVFTVHHSFYQWSGGAQNNLELTILDARIGMFERAYRALSSSIKPSKETLTCSWAKNRQYHSRTWES